MSAVNAGTSAAGKATTNSYQADPGWFWSVVTEETAAEVIVSGVPTGLKHATPADDAGGVAGVGMGAAGLPVPACTWREAIATRGTLGCNPKSPIELGGHWPAGVGGWPRMTCTTIGDPRSRAAGRLAGAGSGPRGGTWLQPATASMRPAAASVLARTDSGRGWHGMSSVLLGGHGAGIRGRCGLGAGGVGGDQRGGGHHDE